MVRIRRALIAAALPLLGGGTLLVVPASLAQIRLEPIGSYSTGVFDQGGAEIVAYDAATRRLFIVNGATGDIDALDLNDPTNPTFAFTIDLAAHGSGANSVAVKDGVVAAAVQAFVKTDPGQAVFFDGDGNVLSAVTVGALPDMIAFTPDGSKALTANEGEPSNDYSVDPLGSVSVIDLTDGAAHLTQADVTTLDFTAFNDRPLDASVRVFGPGATPAQDFEPEYLAAHNDSRFAFATLQENNAIAVIDLVSLKIVDVVGLGHKNHLLPANAFDASDRDNAAHLAPWPVRGLFLPDALAAYRSPLDGRAYLITANEGDAREYDGFAEEERVKNLALDPIAFPNAAELQADENLGRLNVTTTQGDADGDGDYDALYAFGGRSFSILDARTGRRVFDSGSGLERLLAHIHPADFNSDNAENDSFDSRSDNKGPEPEGVAVAELGGRVFAFVGLERDSGIVVADVSDPAAPRFVQYATHRDFSGDPEAGTAGDLGPEGLLFIPAADSPSGEPLLVVGNEVSGTTTVWAIRRD